MDNLQAIACNCALQKMLKDTHFSICTIDHINAVTKAIPDGDAYRILAMLHCVRYQDMPSELLRGLPVLIKRALGGEPIELSMPTSFKLHIERP